MQRFARGNIRGTLQNVCLTGGNWGLQLSLDSWDWQFCQNHPHLPIWSCLRCHFGDTLKTHRFVRTLQLDGQGNVQNSECLKSLWACLGKMIKARLFLWKNLRFLSQVLACIEHSCRCLPEHVLQCYVLQQTSTEMNQENDKRDFSPGRRTVSRRCLSIWTRNSRVVQTSCVAFDEIWFLFC